MNEAVFWASGVSACALLAAVTELLISDSRLEGVVRLVLGLMMLCAVVLPLGGVAAALSEESLASGEISGQDIPLVLSDQRKEYVKNAVRKLIEERLSGRGIVPREIDVVMDMDDSGCISMIRAEIMLSEKDAARAGEIGTDIKKELGISCKTIITGS